jgi:hypothetical protein
MIVDDALEQALRSPDSLSALRTLALQDLAQGQPQAVVLDRFERARQQLRLENREKDEDIVMEIMDFLVGWCSPHMELPPRSSR